MTSDVDTESRCILALIGYLERNDFTDIRQVSRHIMRAKDGTREVCLWVDASRVFRPGGVAVPAGFLRMADELGARPDVICMVTRDAKVRLEHIMNAEPA